MMIVCAVKVHGKDDLRVERRRIVGGDALEQITLL